MSIASLKAGAAEKYYFEKDPIFNADGTNENTTWSGLGAEALGLKGSLDSNEFKNLLAGNAPDGTQLVKGGTTGEHRAALDIPLSAPKSVSHMALVGGDDRLVSAHDKAVKATMDFIEKNYAQARTYEKNEDGSLAKDAKGDPIRIKVTTGNLVVAQAKHSTSRGVDGQMPDPSLHTHNVVMNMTFDKDTGTFKALDTDNMFKDQALIADVYRSELAKEVKALGYGIETKANGTWDIAGSRAEVLENFSKRSAQIDAQVAEMRANGIKGSEDKLRSMAQHNMKSAKDPSISKEDLIANWKEQHKAMGISIDSIKQDMKDVGATMNGGEKMTAKAVLQEVASVLTEKEAVFSREDVLKSGLKMSRGDLSLSDLEKELNSVKKIGQTDGRELKLLKDGSYTTKEMNDIEKDNMRMINNQKTFSAGMTKEQALTAIASYEKEKGFSMTDGQRDAVTALLTSTKQFIAIQGDAGVGKTTMLDAYRTVNDMMGVEKQHLTAIAPTGKAASEAESASGIKSSTVDSFLNQVNKESGRSGGDSAGFVKVPKDLENETFKKKFQIGGGFFGVGISGSGFSSVSKHRDYDRFTGTFKEQKTERILTGEQKGGIRKTELKIHGDTVNRSEKTTLADGTKTTRNTESWNPAKMGMLNLKIVHDTKYQTTVEKDGKLSTFSGRSSNLAGLLSYSRSTSQAEENGKFSKTFENKKASILGFALKTKSEEIRDKQGNLISSVTIKEKSFLGMRVGQATRVEQGKVTQAQYSKQNGQITELKTKETSFDAKNTDAVNKASMKDGELSKADKVIFVDESSMLSAKKANAILKHAEETGARVVLIGDSKQIQSIEAGNTFNQVKEASGSLEVNESVRQRGNADAKAVVDLIASKDIKGGLDLLDKQGNIKEIESKPERLAFAAQRVLKDEKNTLVVASKKSDVKAINDAVREAKFGADKGKEFTVNVSQSVDSFKKGYAESYQKGDIIKSSDKKVGLDFRDTYKVVSVDDKKHSLTVENQKGEQKVLDLKKDGRSLDISKDETRTFKEGDKIVFTKNDKDLKVNNGELGFISKIEGSKITVDMEKKSVTFDTKDFKNLDYGYAITINKSQGTTSKDVVALLDSENKGMNSYNSGYVALSRHKDGLTLITDDLKALTAQVSKEQEKSSSLTSDDKIEKSAKDISASTTDIKSAIETAKKDVSVSVRADNVREDVKISVVAKDVKKDVVVSAKSQDVKSDKKVFVKSADIKPDINVSVKDSDLKIPSGSGVSKVSALAKDVKDDVKISVRADSVKHDVKMQVKSQDVKTTANVSVKSQNIKSDAKVEAKISELKSPDTKMESKAKDVKADAVVVAKVSDIKADVKLDVKADNVKPDAKISVDRDDIKRGSAVEAKSQDVKADTSVSVKRDELKPDTKLEVKADEVKKTVSADVKASDVKENSKIDTKVENVKSDAKAETKVENVKADSSVEAKSQDIQQDTKVQVKTSDVKSGVDISTAKNGKVEVKVSDVKKDVVIQTKQQNVKADANVKATVQDIKADSKLSANVSDVKSLDTKVSAKAGDIKENTKIQVVAGDTKVSSVKVDAKAGDVKDDVKIFVKREDVTNDVKVDVKGKDIKDDATVNAKSQDIKPNTKASVPAQDVRPDAKVQTKFDDLKKDEFKSSDKDAVSDKGSVKDGASASFKKEVEKEESKSAVENKKIVERDSSADVKSSEKVEEAKSAKTSASR